MRERVFAQVGNHRHGELLGLHELGKRRRAQYSHFIHQRERHLNVGRVRVHVDGVVLGQSDMRLVFVLNLDIILEDVVDELAHLLATLTAGLQVAHHLAIDYRPHWIGGLGK